MESRQEESIPQGQTSFSDRGVPARGGVAGRRRSGYAAWQVGSGVGEVVLAPPLYTAATADPSRDFKRLRLSYRHSSLAPARVALFPLGDGAREAVTFLVPPDAV
jgi:hypothetical protein